MELMRKEISAESKLGTALRPYLDRGMMVPDNLVGLVVKERLWKQDCVTRGWVLDAYPNTRSQAELLAKDGFQPTRTIFLELPGKLSLERLCLRR